MNAPSVPDARVYPMQPEYGQSLNECFEVSLEADDWAWTNYFESGKYVTLSMRVMANDPLTESVAALVVFSNVEEGHNAARVGFTGIMHL